MEGTYALKCKPICIHICEGCRIAFIFAMHAAMHSYRKRVKLFPADPRAALAAVTSRENANWLQSQTAVNIRPRRQNRGGANFNTSSNSIRRISGGYQENIRRISGGYLKNTRRISNWLKSQTGVKIRVQESRGATHFKIMFFQFC